MILLCLHHTIRAVLSLKRRSAYHSSRCFYKYAKAVASSITFWPTIIPSRNAERKCLCYKIDLSKIRASSETNALAIRMHAVSFKMTENKRLCLSVESQRGKHTLLGTRRCLELLVNEEGVSSLHILCRSSEQRESMDIEESGTQVCLHSRQICDAHRKQANFNAQKTERERAAQWRFGGCPQEEKGHSGHSLQRSWSLIPGASKDCD